jgi:hypothetical protein
VVANVIECDISDRDTDTSSGMTCSDGSVEAISWAEPCLAKRGLVVDASSLWREWVTVV